MLYFMKLIMAFLDDEFQISKCTDYEDAGAKISTIT